MAEAGRRTILQGGRAKAYRPLPEATRRAAFLAGVAAYERGDFFEALERDLHQGLIKLAAGYVHAVRGNPEGMLKNLRGARDRLEVVALAGSPAIASLPDRGLLDAESLVAAIDQRLHELARTASIGEIDPPKLEAR
jgi:hypothetical protein